MDKVRNKGVRSKSHVATVSNTHYPHGPQGSFALSLRKSETNIKASKYMNFSGIITLNCNVKDLPFHQNAATEKLQERETGAKITSPSSCCN